MGSDFYVGRWVYGHKISIHAPRMGSDVAAGKPTPTNTISIHAPRMGSDISALSGTHVYFLFQSTLPAWGATTVEKYKTAYANDFNPRSPHGERPEAEAEKQATVKFQSTLPAWGATR